MGRATGFEPVISCATDRRLRPLGYARHIGAYACRTALNPLEVSPKELVTIQPSYRSKKPVPLQRWLIPATGTTHSHMGFTDVLASSVVVNQPERRSIRSGAPPLRLPRSLILPEKDSG